MCVLPGHVRLFCDGDWGRDDDARSRPPACQPATRGEGDASSSGVAGRVPMIDTSAAVEVVAKNGKSTHCCMTMGDS